MKTLEVLLNGPIHQRVGAPNVDLKLSEQLRQSSDGARRLYLVISWPGGEQLELPDAIDSDGPGDHKVRVICGENEASIFVFGGRLAYRLGAPGALDARVELYRDASDEEHWDVRFAEVQNGLLVIYEAGVMLLDESLKTRWHVQKRYNDVPEEVKNGIARFVCEEDVWSIVLDTGNPVPSSS